MRQDVLDAAQDALAMVRKSCLKCMNYQTRDHATLIICTHKNATHDFMQDWHEDMPDLLARRASKCKALDPEVLG